MALTPYEPFYDLDHLFTDWIDFPTTTWGTAPTSRRGRRGGDVGTSGPRSARPAMDLYENPKANTVTATFELPGVKKEDVSIDVNNGRLTATAESKMESEREEGGYAVRERRYGRFSRTLQLPEGVKDSDIKAKMEHGILEINFPKSGPEQPPKKITVS